MDGTTLLWLLLIVVTMQLPGALPLLEVEHEKLPPAGIDPHEV